jgi:amino-acid N-acetyltransferase
LKEKRSLRIKPTAALPTDEPTIKELLSSCRLPHEDLTSEHLHHFWVLKKQSQIIGVVGLEIFRPLAFLRSLAIDPKYRNQGLGSQLTQQAEKYGDSLELQALYLLTMTAEDFFAKRGYKKVPREAIPNQIQGTAEFRSLCPATAVCMVKFIEPFTNDGTRHLLR